MTGSLLALLSAAAFALNNIFIRRAVLIVSDASIGTLISVPMGVLVFSLVIVVSGRLPSLLSFTWQGCFWFSLAGIFDFVVGRTLIYHCIQLAGANLASILRRVDILVAVVIGIIALQETFSWQLASGVALIMTGIILAGLSPHAIRQSGGGLARIPARAYMLGFGCGLAWGISPICVKLGLKSWGSPIAGVFVSFLAATLVLGFSLFDARRRTMITEMAVNAAGLFFISGLLGCVANLIRYVALNIAPASIVSPLCKTSPVFLLFFSFLFNRRLEIFNRAVIIGTLMVVLGTIFIV